MNAGIDIADLPPAVRDALIDRALSDLRKALQLRRITSLLPATAPNSSSVSTPGHAVTGAYHMENLA